jgi:hypothetical protein
MSLCMYVVRTVASTELTVQNLEEKASLNAKIEKLTAELEATSKNLEVQVADNAQLGRYDSQSV